MLIFECPFPDATNFPHQDPIEKVEGKVKEGGSIYVGSTFHRKSKRFCAQIILEGRIRHIGAYKTDKEAGIAYAKAVYKYRGQKALDDLREKHLRAIAIDLDGFPPQDPIPIEEGGGNRYLGISFHKAANKWRAHISLEGATRQIGSFETDREAGIAYATAVCKYRGQKALDKLRAQYRHD